MIKQKREKKYKKRLYRKSKMFRLEYKTKNFLIRLCQARKNNKEVKKSKYFDYLGFSFFDFCMHFENYFKKFKEYSWSNYGEWHIDHIKPKSMFKYSVVKDIDYKRCWELSNLQPLHKYENLKKYNKEGV